MLCAKWSWRTFPQSLNIPFRLLLESTFNFLLHAASPRPEVRAKKVGVGLLRHSYCVFLFFLRSRLRNPESSAFIAAPYSDGVFVTCVLKASPSHLQRSRVSRGESVNSVRSRVKFVFGAKLHRGTFLNVIQTHGEYFPSVPQKSRGRGSHHWGRLSSLFCWGYCGGLRVGIGGVMSGLRPPDGGAFAVQRPLDSG